MDFSVSLFLHLNIYLYLRNSTDQSQRKNPIDPMMFLSCLSQLSCVAYVGVSDTGALSAGCWVCLCFARFPTLPFLNFLCWKNSNFPVTKMRCLQNSSKKHTCCPASERQFFKHQDNVMSMLIR